ncbi:MAG: hypothetical protein VKJ64_03280 [Leptolyngbyaceae bacterium]|nr:hypothetical protein [Leptolyngbyaceae bacterium]
MGKFTDSLREATNQLKNIQQGIDAMTATGQDLADNALEVADAALRAGYAYGKAEVIQASQIALASPENSVNPSVKPIDVASSEFVVLDAGQLEGGDRWTQQSLKKRFGQFESAYQHLRDVHGIRPKKRSWQSVVDGFNGLLAPPQPTASSHPLGPNVQDNTLTEAGLHHRSSPPPAIADRLTQLEAIVAVQQQRILDLEQQVAQLMP